MELLVRAQQRDPVFHRHRLVAPGAGDQLVVGVGDHADRRQAAVQLAQRAVARRAHLGGHEPGVAERDVAGTAPDARFHHRRRKQRGHVQHAHRAEHVLHRVRHRRVVEVGHHAHVRAQVADQQHGLQRAQVGGLRAHHRGGAQDPGFIQRVAEVGAAVQMGYAPPAHHPRQALVGVVVEHHHARAGQVQLLDRTQPHRIEAAYDHVPSPIATGLRVRMRTSYLRGHVG